ncbi:hypothetical protein SAMN05518672_104384 [Chitinophaga sp. CF118]|nr:hypothetical protein SAMN05518672_104384 [Chitinophaga sp. CF118]
MQKFISFIVTELLFLLPAEKDNQNLYSPYEKSQYYTIFSKIINFI